MFTLRSFRNGVCTSGGTGADGSAPSGIVSSTAADLEEQLRLSKLEKKALKFAGFL